tara:strand:+ start:905 stop:1072 length:168 start_codon:yes stop_codon:yes gene_type:complete
VFGQLSSGHFGAKNQDGKKKIYTSISEMDKSIQIFMQLGFTKPSAELVKQLSLAL